MEIWLRTSTADAPTNVEDYDRIFGDEQEQPRLNIDGQRLLYDGNVIGAYIRVKDGETQNLGIEHLGTVEWILVECETWSMIPLENLIYFFLLTRLIPRRSIIPKFFCRFS